MDRIDECKKEYTSWCKSIGICDAHDVNRIIASGKTSELIALSERRHADKISDIASAISKGKKRIILISGPSSSGKTTFAKRLILDLKDNGISAVSVSLDDYYMAKDKMPLGEDGKPDFERLDAINYARFNEDIARLVLGKITVMPAFDFVNAQPIENARTVKLDKDEVIIVEGIHGLNPKVCDTVDEDKKYRIYCSAISTIKDSNGERIGSDTTRMIRRLIRDYYFRNTDYKTTFSLWPNQELGSRKYIFPYTDTADVIFNSAMPYEFSVYRPHLLKVLDGAEGEYGEIAGDLKAMIYGFDEICQDDVPGGSLIREFVGGSEFKY